MFSIIEPTHRVDVTGKMLLIIAVSVVFNMFIGIEASCENPLSPEHGTLLLSGNSKVNSLALYSCDNGWNLVGAAISKCLITGEWTSLPPKCVAEKRSSNLTTETAFAPRPTPVGSALPERTAASVDNEKLDPPTTPNRIQESNCSCTYNSHDRKLSADVNGLGLWNGDRVRKGDKMTLRCYGQAKNLVLPNATIIPGTLELACDVCRVWEDSDLPSCEDVRSEPCSIPFVQNGRIGKWVSQSFGRNSYYQAIPVGQRIEDGDRFFLHCDNGYIPLGIAKNWQAMMICRSGKWSDDPFCELTTCQAEPPQTENGRVEKIDRKHDGTVSYECLPNFIQVKTGNVSCSMGEWKGMPPTCKNGDCTVPWIQNGHIQERILGPSEYRWRTIKWERQVIDNKLGVGSVLSRDATLSLVCDSRYSIQGTETSSGGITCSEGRWSPDPVCLRTGTQFRRTTEAPRSVTTNRVTVKKLTTIRTTPSTRSTTMSDESRFVSGTVGSKSTTTTPIASEVPAEADHGENYVPPNSEEFEDECYCEYLPDGNLIAHADGKEIKMNDKVKNGTVLQFRCEKVGFHKLFGPTEVLCDNCRAWSSSDFPSCINPIRGDTIIVYGTVNVSPDGVLEPRKGQSLRLSCAVVETRGFPEWHFPNVTGIEITKERRERTGDILYLSYLNITNITSKYSGSYSCAFDEKNPTIVQLQVVDPEARCRRFSIDDEELDVQYDGSDTRVGRRATFSCRRNGQNLNGTSVATCLKSEEWSSPPPQCIGVVGCHLNVVDRQSKRIIKPMKESYRFGESVIVLCPVAFQLTSDVERVVCMGSEWSDAVPDCQKIPD